MTRQSTIIIGIGSHHGDDRAGWRAVELLQPHLGPEVVARTIRNPLDMLALIHDCERLWIIDAVQSSDEASTLHRWQWPSIPPESTRLCNSHAVGIVEVLELATKLGQLPPHVIIWGIEVDALRCQPCDTHMPLSSSVETQLHTLVAEVLKALEPAAIFSGASYA